MAELNGYISGIGSCTNARAWAVAAGGGSTVLFGCPDIALLSTGFGTSTSCSVGTVTESAPAAAVTALEDGIRMASGS